MASLVSRCVMTLSRSQVLHKTATLSHLRPSRRCFASADKWVDISMNKETEVATVTLQRPPVNGLNLELLQQLIAALDSLEDADCRGMILTSASPTIFSGGLDIMEMYKPKPERLEQFWTAVQDVWLKLYSSPYPTVAAINGHSPAGGCLLALCCEYRVMVGPKFTIGLNETQLGIVAPRWFVYSMSNVIGLRQAELALTTGRMFKTDEALAVGLVDEVATDKADAIAKAEAFLKRFKSIPPLARNLAKQVVREDAITWLECNKESDLERFVNTVSLPAVQQGLEMYLAMMKSKSKK